MFLRVLVKVPQVLKGSVVFEEVPRLDEADPGFNSKYFPLSTFLGVSRHFEVLGNNCMCFKAVQGLQCLLREL